MSLTAREAEVLAVMWAFPEEPLVYERGDAWLGGVHLSARLVFSLIRKMCISEIGEPAPVEHYRINSTGRRALRDHWGVGCGGGEDE
jgi:hypothetical protein